MHFLRRKINYLEINKFAGDALSLFIIQSLQNWSASTYQQISTRKKYIKSSLSWNNLKIKNNKEEPKYG